MVVEVVTSLRLLFQQASGAETGIFARFSYYYAPAGDLLTGPYLSYMLLCPVGA